MKLDDEICKGVSCPECSFNKWKDGCLLAKRLDEIEITPEPCEEHTETHSCENKRTETHDSRREWYMKGYRDAQPRWIPVTEALPEDGVTVWVTIRGHDVIRCEDGETLEQAIARISKIRWVTQGYWSEEEQGWNDPSFGCPLMVQPVAWMPMEVPEPYKGGTR